MRTKSYKVARCDSDASQREARENNPTCVATADSKTCGCGAATEQAWIGSSIRRCVASRVVLYARKAVRP